MRYNGASMSKISLEDVRRVARLARIAVGEPEAQTLRAELEAVLHHMAELDALDVSDVEPTLHPVTLDAPLRPDEVAASLTQAEALAGAPEAQDGGFAVPAVLAGDG